MSDVGADSGVTAEWINNKRIVGLWAINEARNAWVYVSDTGWKRISPENDTIFLSMLRQLVTAKGANRPVNVYLKDNVVQQVYVL